MAVVRLLVEQNGGDINAKNDYGQMILISILDSYGWLSIS